MSDFICTVCGGYVRPSPGSVADHLANCAPRNGRHRVFGKLCDDRDSLRAEVERLRGQAACLHRQWSATESIQGETHMECTRCGYVDPTPLGRR